MYFFENCECRNLFLEHGALDIEKYNGKYVKTEFDPSESSIQLIKGMKVEYDDDTYTGVYHGMVNHLG